MSKLREQFIENSKADAEFCRKYAKQKNGLDFIPWARMWSTVRGRYDEVTYLSDVRRAGEQGYEVSVAVVVRLGDETSDPVEAVLAVTNHANKVIPEPSSADVQNTRQRALAKALSMATGIGLSLWFGSI